MNEEKRLSVPIVGGIYHGSEYLLRGEKKIQDFQRGHQVQNYRPIHLDRGDSIYSALVPVEIDRAEARRLVAKYFRL